MSADAGTHRDQHPGTHRPPAMGALPLDGGAGAGHRLDPRRPRGHHRRQRRGPPDGEGERHLDHGRGHRDGRGHLRVGRVPRRALLRPADRSLRPQAAVHPDARRLHHRDGGDRLRVRSLVPVPRALLHRRRHRRRVRGDQLGDRRADPRARARPRRSDDQRQLLGRCRARLGRRPDLPEHRPVREGRRLAARLRLRGRARADDPASSAGTCPRARAGSSSTGARRRPSRSSRRSRRPSRRRPTRRSSTPDETITVRQRKTVPFREIARRRLLEVPEARRSSASRSSSARPSCTTRSRSTSARS